MNIYQFNKVIYKGNVNFDFYLYCLKKDIKLIRFLFINIIYFLLSCLLYSKKEIYDIRKYRYLKYVKNLNTKVKDFYKKDRLNKGIEIEKGIVIDDIPKVLMINDYTKENRVIGYDLDKNFDIDITNFNKEIKTIKECDNLFIRNRNNLENITSLKTFVVNNNKIKYIEKRKKYLKNIQLITILLLSLILTCISFCYTNHIVDLDMIKSYFEIRLFTMNFLIIFLFMILLFVLFKRVHVAFLINSFLIMCLGIANQTKILYRDDIVKFEDLFLLKEAATMTQRYEVLIKWYTIIFIILIIIVTLLLKKYIKKLNVILWKRLIIIILILITIFSSYKLLYMNEDIYNSLGKKELINQWITTRQYQIRGLVYPFIYTLEDGFVTPPEDYDEQQAIKALDKYKYQNIAENKKVNIIAIMLEAYNDFSKFDEVEFEEDIYEKFHKIQETSISGNLVTSIFGGGTIVTERSFLTGYYDFPTFRGNTNSYVWYFKNQGYRTEAMHPIYGAFYNRASVNINLGFDDYYYYENMFSKYNEGFMKDDEFFDYIIKGYEDSKNEDIPYFNFSVTYQNHGPYYADNYEGKKYYITNNDYDESAYNIINEYFNGIKETNDALEKLITYFDNEDEPVIVILFGDHNPFLDNGYSELGIDLSLDTVEGFLNYYQTPYIIHANKSAKDIFDKEFIGKGNDISPMFLMNELFDYCELEGNEYLQYMSNLKEHVDVINPYYNKEDLEYVSSKESNYTNELNEYSWVNYYEANNYHK